MKTVLFVYLLILLVNIWFLSCVFFVRKAVSYGNSGFLHISGQETPVVMMTYKELSSPGQ